MSNGLTYLSLDQKIEIIGSIPEVEFHEYMRDLLHKMSPEALVAITHGTAEYGKDIVLLNSEGYTNRVDAFVIKKGDLTGRASVTSGLVDSMRNAALPLSKAEKLIIEQAR